MNQSHSRFKIEEKPENKKSQRSTGQFGAVIPLTEYKLNSVCNADQNRIQRKTLYSHTGRTKINYEVIITQYIGQVKSAMPYIDFHFFIKLCRRIFQSPSFLGVWVNSGQDRTAPYAFLHLEKFITFPEGVIQEWRIVCDDKSVPTVEIPHSGACKYAAEHRRRKWPFGNFTN
jgi:hypothetical protein